PTSTPRSTRPWGSTLPRNSTPPAARSRSRTTVGRSPSCSDETGLRAAPASLRRRQEELQTLHAEVEPEQRAGLAAGDVELIEVGAGERDVGRRPVAARVAADDLALGADDLHLPHP